MHFVWTAEGMEQAKGSVNRQTKGQRGNFLWVYKYVYTHVLLDPQKTTYPTV